MSNLTAWVAEAREAAANPEHEWDRMALEWPLTPDSIVVEVGGYKGRWALQIAQRYNPNLYIYEPQGWCCEVIAEALKGYKTRIHNYALGTADTRLMLSHAGTDGASLVTTGGQRTAVEVRDAAKVLPAYIDLMLVNIEGYEYTLLPYLLDRAILPRFLCVQFHPHADPWGSKAIGFGQRLVSLGYRELWTYGITLTAWERVR